MKKIIFILCSILFVSSLYSSVSIVDSITYKNKEYFANTIEATFTFLDIYSVIPAFSLSKDLGDDDSKYTKSIAFGASIDALPWLNLYANYDHLLPTDNYKNSTIEIAPTFIIEMNNFITYLRIGYAYTKHEYEIQFDTIAEAGGYGFSSFAYTLPSVPGGSGIPNLIKYTFELTQNIYSFTISETIHEKTTVEIGGTYYEYDKVLNILKNKQISSYFMQGLKLTESTGILQFFPNYYINTGITRSFFQNTTEIFFYYIATKYELTSVFKNGFLIGITYYFTDNFSIGINVNSSQNMNNKLENYLGADIGYSF